MLEINRLVGRFASGAHAHASLGGDMRTAQAKLGTRKHRIAEADRAGVTPGQPLQQLAADSALA